MEDPDKSNWLPMILTGMLVGVILMVLWLINFRIAPAATKDLQISYADMAAIVLTGVSVMVAVLAVFIAALAIWGYSQFGKVTQNASKTHLEKLLRDGPFKQQIDGVIIEHVSAQLARGELRNILMSKVDELILRDAETRERDESSTNTREYTD